MMPKVYLSLQCHHGSTKLSLSKSSIIFNYLNPNSISIRSATVYIKIDSGSEAPILTPLESEMNTSIHNVLYL